MSARAASVLAMLLASGVVGSGCTLVLDRDRHHGSTAVDAGRVTPRDAGPRDAQSIDAGVDAGLRIGGPCELDEHCGLPALASCEWLGEPTHRCVACELGLSEVLYVEPPAGGMLLPEAQLALEHTGDQTVLHVLLHQQAPEGSIPYVLSLDVTAPERWSPDLASLESLWGRDVSRAAIASVHGHVSVAATPRSRSAGYELAVGPPRPKRGFEVIEHSLPDAATSGALHDLHPGTATWTAAASWIGARQDDTSGEWELLAIGPELGELVRGPRIASGSFASIVGASQHGLAIYYEPSVFVAWRWPTGERAPLAIPGGVSGRGGLHMASSGERVVLAYPSGSGVLSVAEVLVGEGMDPRIDPIVRSADVLGAGSGEMRELLDLTALPQGWAALLHEHGARRQLVLVGFGADRQLHTLVTPTLESGRGGVVVLDAGADAVVQARLLGFQLGTVPMLAIDAALSDGRHALRLITGCNR